MKEYEKLADEYCQQNLESSWDSQCLLEQGFVAGFLKAREMALEVVTPALTRKEIICGLIDLGEKEV